MTLIAYLAPRSSNLPPSRAQAQLSRLEWAIATTDPARHSEADRDGLAAARAFCITSELDTLGVDKPETHCKGYAPMRPQHPIFMVAPYCGRGAAADSPGKFREPFSWALAPLSDAPGGPPSAYTVYVTNEKDNTVSIIDSEKLEVVKTIKVGQRPRGIILSKDGKWLIDLRQRRQYRAGLRRQDSEFVKTLPSGTDPELLHPASRRATRSTSPTRTTISSPSSTSPKVPSGRHPRRRRA